MLNFVIQNPVATASTAVALLGATFLLRKYFAGGVCKDVVDLQGKLVIVTGANTGIGFETAKALAHMKGHIILACRDKKKGNQAAEQLKKETGNPNVESMQLDLSSYASVKEFVEEFKKKQLPIDILINNAGMYCSSFAETVDGNEMIFGTNYLGPFLLTILLLDQVKASKGRIVNVSSNAQFYAAIDLDDLNWKNRKSKWTSLQAYRDSKAAQTLFTMELEKRLVGSGAHTYALHPGLIPTQILKDAGFLGSVLNTIGRYTGKTPKQGAQTSIYAAISPKLEGKGGLYLMDCKVIDAGKYSKDSERAKKLWTLSEKLVGLEN